MVQKRELRRRGLLPPATAGEGGRQFAPGNGAPISHGSYSSDLRLSEEPETIALTDSIRATMPVTDPADEGAIERLAIAYRRIQRASALLDRVDATLAAEDKELGAYQSEYLGKLRHDLQGWLREAGRIEAELGRTTASRAKLGLHLATARRALTLADLHEQAALEEAVVEGEAEETDDAA